jgi:hypothetical protein
MPLLGHHAREAGFQPLLDHVILGETLLHNIYPLAFRRNW